MDKQVLFVRVKCTICLGKVHSCPYCDETGRVYIEASHKSITKYLKESLSKEEKEDFVEMLENA